MKTVLRFLICLAVINLVSQRIEAGEWNGIVPLHSTCEDVEQKLKIKACSLSEVKYETQDAKVTVYISTEPNEKMFQRRCNVPIGTVLEIIIEYKIYDSSARFILLKEFVKDASKFKKSSDDISYFYSNEESGEDFMTTFDDIVRAIRYSPTKKDLGLFCKNESK